MNAPAQRERSVAELFGDLAGETSQLLRQEVRLATHELTHKLTLVGWQAVTVLIGALLAMIGIGYLLAAAVVGVATQLPLWLACLIVGGGVTFIAVATLMKGALALKKLDMTPRQTLQTLQETKQWARQQIQ